MGTVRYTVMNGQIVAEKRGAIRSHYVSDSTGSTVALSNSFATITDTYAYWPYGELVSSTGTTGTPFRFVGTLGYYRDNAERQYIRRRFYDPARGNFLTP